MACSSSEMVWGQNGVLINGAFYKRVEEGGAGFTCSSFFKDLGAYLCGGKTSMDEQKEIEALKEKERKQKQAEKDKKELAAACLAALISSLAGAYSAQTTEEKKVEEKKEEKKEEKVEEKVEEKKEETPVEEEGKELFK